MTAPMMHCGTSLTAMFLLASAAPSAGGEPCPPEWEPAFVYDTNLYPFTSHCMELAQGTLHYVDEAPEGVSRGTMLMLHGRFARSVSTWRCAASCLAT